MEGQPDARRSDLFIPGQLRGFGVAFGEHRGMHSHAPCTSAPSASCILQTRPRRCNCLKTQTREGERPREPEFPIVPGHVWAREDTRPHWFTRVTNICGFYRCEAAQKKGYVDTVYRNC